MIEIKAAQSIIGHMRAHNQDAIRTHHLMRDHIEAHDIMSSRGHGLGHMSGEGHGKIHTRGDPHSKVHMIGSQDPILGSQSPHEEKSMMDSAQGRLGLYEWNITISR